MKREYLVMYEKTADNWSAFSLEWPGCDSVGDTLEDTHANMREAMELYLTETAGEGQALPVASATSVDIDDFDPQQESEQYFLGRLGVSLPKTEKPSTEMQAA